MLQQTYLCALIGLLNHQMITEMALITSTNELTEKLNLFIIHLYSCAGIFVIAVFV